MAELIHRNQHQQLVQNCDLPPPTKLYFDNPIHTPQPDNLAKALQLSQARARDAESRLEEAMKETTFAINALVSESIRLMAYWRWVTMLEIRVQKLKAMEEDAAATRRLFRRVAPERDDEDGVEKWKVGLVICLGLTGLGLAYRFGFL